MAEVSPAWPEPGPETLDGGHTELIVRRMPTPANHEERQAIDARHLTAGKRQAWRIAGG